MAKCTYKLTKKETVMSERFISECERDEQVQLFQRDLFALVFANVDSGKLSPDQAYSQLDVAAQDPEFAMHLFETGGVETLQTVES